MKVIINPSQLAFPHVTVPPSKSLAHRAVICAALAKGVSRIDNIDYSVDIKATLAAMEVLGAKVFYGEDFVLIEGIDSIQSIQFVAGNEFVQLSLPAHRRCQNRRYLRIRGLNASGLQYWHESFAGTGNCQCLQAFV